jgi:maltose/moltooligosaccharide transporter
MNFGFLGIQYSFGLQQSAINPIYALLGAQPENLPYLNLAGPITGLLIQPLIGAWSDKTWHPKWGRRKPFFLLGAIGCSLCLFAFPFCSTLWLAAGLLWMLDAANNTSMEPYRAFIADHLHEEQHAQGFLAQSFFTGLGITLANLSIYFFQKLFHQPLTPGSLPIWVYISFFIGAFISFSSVYFSTRKLKEYPPTQEELTAIQNNPTSLLKSIADVVKAIGEMPKILWQLALVYLFQWYALFCYWEFISLAVAKQFWHTTDTTSLQFQEGVGWAAFMNATYNAIAFIISLLLIPLTKKVRARNVHAYCLLLAGLGLSLFSYWNNSNLALFSMVGLGIAWASIMGVPYIFVVPHIPKEKYGVYMGIINMMIVIPMFIQTLTFSKIYTQLLQSKPEHAITFAGVLLVLASVATFFIRDRVEPKLV